VLLAIALVDWLYQRWQHREDLKMTRREWLDDLRRSEGDPRNKARRRRAGTELVGRIRQEQQR
jgi:flagellar biosynthetic protein FlhB